MTTSQTSSFMLGTTPSGLRSVEVSLGPRPRPVASQRTTATTYGGARCARRIDRFASSHASILTVVKLRHRGAPLPIRLPEHGRALRVAGALQRLNRGPRCGERLLDVLIPKVNCRQVRHHNRPLLRAALRQHGRDLGSRLDNVESLKMRPETLDKCLERELSLFSRGQGGTADNPCGCVRVQPKGQEQRAVRSVMIRGLKPGSH
jgi:hypothetical protein